MSDEIEPADEWAQLRRYTNARIGLGRSGDGLPTRPMLAFQLDHARARDAVHTPLDVAALGAQLAAQGREVIRLHSRAADRGTYLRRPDLGRQLDEVSRAALASHAAERGRGYDIVFVIADGLSARAVQQHAAHLLEHVLPTLEGLGWSIGPLAVVEQGRVAVGDEAGQILRAQQVAVLVGERPGLSVADSLGIYLTYEPRPGRTDAERNCISNIHGAGQSYREASETLLYLMSEARRLRLTGVALKDDRAQGNAAALGA